MIFKYSKYPKAAKEFLRFMMEEEQVTPVGDGVDRLRDAGARGVREAPGLDRTRRRRRIATP